MIQKLINKHKNDKRDKHTCFQISYEKQNGRCPVVGKPFVEVEGIHCHHIVPKCRGGDDSYHNLILINKVVTPLLREISKEASKMLIKELGIKKKGIGKVNYLRHRLGLESI